MSDTDPQVPDLLRRAAQHMRDTAQNDLAPAPWERRRDDTDDGETIWWVATRHQGATVAVCGDEHTTGPRDAAHIALWHPGVARAVADWLEACADAWPTQLIATTTPERARERRAAVATAHALLGEDD